MLLEYPVSAVTSGKDALGEARVVCDIGGRRFARPVGLDRRPGGERDRLRPGRQRSRHAEHGERVAAGVCEMGRRCSQKVWDAHVVRPGGRRDGAGDPLHRPPPGPRGHLAAGLRRPAPARAARVRRPDLTLATVDHNVPTIGPRARRSPTRSRARRSRPWSATAREFGIPLYALRSAAPGHRPRDRPRAGPDAAGHDHRLRRQPHLHPRRLRRAGLRHRHQRGRARPRHPDACRRRKPKTMRDHASRASSAAASRAKDIILGHHRPDRHRRRAPATSSSTPAPPSARSRWKAG